MIFFLVTKSKQNIHVGLKSQITQKPNRDLGLIRFYFEILKFRGFVEANVLPFWVMLVTKRYDYS